MENLENMEKIEALQTELGQFLVSFIPVPWKKICFYADAVPGSASSWFAFVEQETDVICTQDFFWKRRFRELLPKYFSLNLVTFLVECFYLVLVPQFFSPSENSLACSALADQARENNRLKCF